MLAADLLDEPEVTDRPGGRHDQQRVDLGTHEEINVQIAVTEYSVQSWSAALLITSKVAMIRPTVNGAKPFSTAIRHFDSSARCQNNVTHIDRGCWQDHRRGRDEATEVLYHLQVGGGDTQLTPQIERAAVDVTDPTSALVLSAISK